MRKKKRSLLIVIFAISSLVVLNLQTVLAEKTNSENQEFPDKFMNIINGSDEIYGEGVPLEHLTEDDKSAIQPRFKSGGVDHTHQYILASALYIIKNDKGSSILNTENNLEVLLVNTDWPDKLGNETDGGTFAGHFYDPDTGKNWLGQTSPTAKSRAIEYYNRAVESYKAGNVQTALVSLGRGTHYISDLNEPHHAANKTAVDSNHSAFEKYVDENRTSYKIMNNSLSASIYQTSIDSNLDTLIDRQAHSAKSLYQLAANESTYSSAANSSVKNAMTSVVQYVYRFGKEVGIF